MKKKILYLIVIALFFVCGNSVAQGYWKNYTKENGLLSNYITDHLVRSNGDVWLSSANGISIFDGENWLQQKRIVDILTGKKKTIIGTSFIWEDKTHMVWVYNHWGVFIFDGNNWKILPKKWKGNPYVRYFLMDSKGKFWVCLQEFKASQPGSFLPSYLIGQVCKFNGEKWINYTSTVGGSYSATITGFNTYFTSIFEDKKGNIWIGTVNGAFKFNGKEWTVIKKKSGNILSNYVYFIKQDSKGNIWIGTDNGLSRYSENQWKTYTKEDGFPGKSVYFLWEVSNDYLWVLTKAKSPVNTYKGLCNLRNDKWISYNSDTNLVTQVRSLAGYGERDVWVCGQDGVSVFDGMSWKKYSYADGIKNGFYIRLYKDMKNNIWAYSKNSVIKYDSVQWTSYEKETEKGKDWKINFLKEDTRGTIWVGTNNNGLFAFDGSNWTHYDETNGWIDNKVQSLFEDKKGNIWVITKKGVAVYHIGTEKLSNN